MSSIKKADYIAKFGEEAWAVEHEKRKAYLKAYYKSHKEKLNKANMDYYESHKEQLLSWQKEYDNNHRENRSAIQKRYYEKNKETIKEKAREKAPERRGYYRDYVRKRRKTTTGRAQQLLDGYRYKDKINNRGTCTITKNWIINKIFTSSCVYCGDSDWAHLGCDRIDNSLPHTPENCICACGICNIEREYKEMSVDEFKKYRAANPRECDKQKRE